MIRVILADDHAVMRDGLRYILETAGGFEIVGEASDGSATLALVERGAADVLLLDLSMPAPTGIELIRLVKRHAPSLRTLVLTMHAEAQYAARAFNRRNRLPDEGQRDRRVEAVGKVAAGGVYVAVGGREPRAHAAHAGRRAAARTAVRARVRRDAPHRRRPDRHADRDRTRAQRKDGQHLQDPDPREDGAAARSRAGPLRGAPRTRPGGDA